MRRSFALVLVLALFVVGPSLASDTTVAKLFNALYPPELVVDVGPVPCQEIGRELAAAVSEQKKEGYREVRRFIERMGIADASSQRNDLPNCLGTITFRHDG